MSTNQNQTGLKLSYGKAIIENGFSGITFTLNTTPTELGTLAAGTWTVDVNSVDFAMTTNGRLKYTGSKTKWFMVAGNIATGDTQLELAELRKNGIAYNTSYQYAGSDYGAIGPISTPMQLAKDDYISFFFRRQSSSVSIPIWQVQMSAIEIPEA